MLMIEVGLHFLFHTRESKRFRSEIKFFTTSKSRVLLHPSIEQQIIIIIIIIIIVIITTTIIVVVIIIITTTIISIIIVIIHTVTIRSHWLIIIYYNFAPTDFYQLVIVVVVIIIIVIIIIIIIIIISMNYYQHLQLLLQSSLISLKSLLVREKADSRDCKGLYLICSSDTPIPEMLELSFKCAEERNRWCCAIRESKSSNLQKQGDNEAPASTGPRLARCNEATALNDKSFRSGSMQNRGQGSAYDEATLAQLQSLVGESIGRGGLSVEVLTLKRRTFIISSNY